MAPRRLRDCLDRFVLPLPFSLPFGIVFGFVLAPLWMPKSTPGRAPMLGNWTRRGSRRCWGRLGSVLFSSCGLRSIFEPSWASLGVVLGCSWRVVTEWQPFSSSLLHFRVLFGLWEVLLGLCWSKMRSYFHLPWFPPALFRSSHQPCAFMALHLL